eukprot:scaffold69932_cov52-Attheya_sp.AAC.2
MDDTQITRTYNHMVLQGKLCQAVRWITERHKGAISILMMSMSSQGSVQDMLDTPQQTSSVIR